MILFLDFDGVLHPEYQGTTVPEEVAFCHLPRFEAVMRDYPYVDIVISSTWSETLSLERIKARFTSDIRERIVGMTPIDRREGFARRTGAKARSYGGSRRTGALRRNGSRSMIASGSSPGTEIA